MIRVGHLLVLKCTKIQITELSFLILFSLEYFPNWALKDKGGACVSAEERVTLKYEVELK